MVYSYRRNTARPKFFPARSAFPPASSPKRFDRINELPKLIGLWPSDLNDYSEDGTAKIVGMLQKALRSERRRGRAGHWSYDLNRHAALAEALKIETTRLREHAAVYRSPQAAQNEEAPSAVE